MECAVIVFVHGAGRHGRDAWPSMEIADAVFADFSSERSVGRQADSLIELVTGPTIVVAHSHGAIPVLLALPLIRRQVKALVLLEPALYDVARGDPSVEAHISAMEHAREVLAAEGLESFWRVVRPRMFAGPLRSEEWEHERARAARFAEIVPPWGHGIEASTIEGTETHVISGGWNDEYEAIAAALSRHGALHQMFAGSHHRPQDDPRFATALRTVRASHAGG
ncbi:MAG: hypothetical protein BGO94_14095 [Micrococcales bacterium 72-143]|nr:MAG: hypothetical protein BGO94_14095 [Micrococcales bacterium 72-143]